MSFLHKNIINFNPVIFGLDLNDLSIKILQLEKEGKRDKIRSFAAFDIPPGNIEDGKIIEKDKVALFIKEAVRRTGPRRINTRKVICSLPESKAFLRIISIPEMGEAEAEEAVRWEIEANTPLPINQVYFDWQFLESVEKNKRRVLTVAVAREMVDDLMEVLGKAGLDVYGLELESIATTRSLIPEKGNSQQETYLIIDLGAQRTSFIMVVRGVTYFTSSIPFSSETMNDAIAKKLNLSLEEAEQAKVNQGIDYLNEDNPIFSAVNPLLENLVSEIEKTMDFCTEIIKENSEIKEIILTGGGANLNGLVSYLTQKLGKEVATGNPWINLNLGKKLPTISREKSFRYSTVLGLALRGIFYENQS